jgi:hypothetical protein
MDSNISKVIRLNTISVYSRQFRSLEGIANKLPAALLRSSIRATKEAVKMFDLPSETPTVQAAISRIVCRQKADLTDQGFNIMHAEALKDNLTGNYVTKEKMKDRRYNDIFLWTSFVISGSAIMIATNDISVLLGGCLLATLDAVWELQRIKAEKTNRDLIGMANEFQGLLLRSVKDE